MTVTDWLYDAMRIAGILKGPGHTWQVGSPIFTDSLRAANNMLLAWSNNRLDIPWVSLVTQNTVSGQQAYLAGPKGMSLPGPDWLMPRPKRIEHANVLLASSGSGTAGPAPIRLPLYLHTPASWAAKVFQNVNSIPLELYNDENAPLSTFKFYPIPDQAYVIEFYCWMPIGTLLLATDVLLLPEGYEEPLVYELAKRLAALWRTELTPAAMEIAAKSYADLQSLNSRSVPIHLEPGLGGSGRRSGWNWLSGQSER